MMTDAIKPADEFILYTTDYQPSTKESTRFFQTIQNKLHFAATSKTSAKLNWERADASQPNIGLTVWKGEVARSFTESQPERPPAA